VNAIVIGAGVVGLSVACELASRGVAVRVVDSRRPGQGATQASAGILAPYIEAHSDPLLALGVCSLNQYDAFIDRLRRLSGLAVEYHRAGTLQVACDAAAAEELAGAARRFAARGIPHALISGAEARKREPALADTVSTALELPGHGHVGVSSLLRALERAAVIQGIVLTEAHVQEVMEQHGRSAVRTGRGCFDADAVVIAAGAWHDGIPVAGVRAPAVHPVRGQLLHLRTSRVAASRVLWGRGCYLVPWQDGSVLVGATAEEVGFDERATVEGVRRLVDAGVALMPRLTEAELVAVRVGLRPGTRDELPLIGPSATLRGVFHAAGHYRSGVLLAPLTASLVADLVIDGRARPDLAHVAPSRVGL
jgi:glycine oxidase